MKKLLEFGSGTGVSPVSSRFGFGGQLLRRTGETPVPL